MKLDDEMRAALFNAMNECAAGAGADAILLAGYRMGLERAAQLLENAPLEWSEPADAAAAIRGIASE